MAHTLNIRGRLYNLCEPKVMGILNLTPDSFFAESREHDIPSVLKKIEAFLKEGMDILDIGAVSTRPGADLPDEEVEFARLEAPLKAIVKAFPDLIVSIDTFRSGIALRCADMGAGIINDISGGDSDPDMFALMGRLQLPYILTHIKGKPQTMQDNPVYEDVVDELIADLSQKAGRARMAGVHDIIIDPGFGFGKTLEHNYAILAHLREFSVLEMPLMAGISRKSMLYKLLDCRPEEALNATTAANMLALHNGADILRVHDVKEAVQCVKIFKQYSKNLA